MRSFDVYRLEDTDRYETWKNTSLRFLSAQFPGDICISEFKETVSEFVKYDYLPEVFDRMLGVLKSCAVIPVPFSAKESGDMDKTININVNQQQCRIRLSNRVRLSIFFIEAMRNELTGKQYNE